MKNHLEITISDKNSFYTLYSEGNHAWKTYNQKEKHTLIYYPPESVIFLFYTYITYREACVVRFSEINDNSVSLPGLSKKVTVLFRVKASRVDKLKRAVGWLNKHSAGACSHRDGFYIRLQYILEQRGKINYTAIRELAVNSPVQNQFKLF